MNRSYDHILLLSLPTYSSIFFSNHFVKQLFRLKQPIFQQFIIIISQQKNKEMSVLLLLKQGCQKGFK